MYINIILLHNNEIYNIVIVSSFYNNQYDRTGFRNSSLPTHHVNCYRYIVRLYQLCIYIIHCTYIQTYIPICFLLSKESVTPTGTSTMRSSPSSPISIIRLKNRKTQVRTDEQFVWRSHVFVRVIIDSCLTLYKQGKATP